VAGLLDVRVGAPLLSIERTVYTEDGRPIEYVHVLYRSDRYNYTVMLTRDSSSQDNPVSAKSGKTARRAAGAKSASRKVKSRN